jgi:hypothetical protein
VSREVERLARPFETVSGTAEPRVTSPLFPAETTDPFGTLVENT